MATLVSRLTKIGEVFVNGQFDEVTKSINSTSSNTIFSSEFDEVNISPFVGALPATSTTGTTFVIDYPVGTQIGDLAIVAFSARNNFGANATATGWTVINRDSTTINTKAQISYKIVTDLNQVTFTKSTASSTAPTAEIIVIRASSFSTYAKATATTNSTPDPAAVTSTGAVIQTLHTDVITGDYTPPVGYKLAGFNLSTEGGTTAIAYKLVGADASEDAGVWTTGSTTSWVTYSIAIAGSGLLVPARRQTNTGKLLVSSNFDEVTGIS